MDSSKRRQGIIVTTTLEEIHGRTTTDPQQRPKTFDISTHANNNIITTISSISKVPKEITVVAHRQFKFMTKNDTT
jgi:hypothetical protein